MRHWCLLATLSGLLLLAPEGSSWAWNTADYWHTANKNTRGGGDGIYGTGGVQDQRIECVHCHVKGAGTIGATLTFSPALIKVANEERYRPDQIYQITVELTGEHLGLDKGDNLNGFGATIENDSGRSTGRLQADSGGRSDNCPATLAQTQMNSPPYQGKTTFMFGDCHGVLHIENSTTKGTNNRKWYFSWTAPAAGAGNATMYYGVVDGGHGTAKEGSLDDDTKMSKKLLVEGP